MKTSSAKAKGRNLQKWARDKILENFPSLTENDVRSTSMGASGEDILFSEAAVSTLGINVECKSRAAINVYSMYEQAAKESKGTEPVLFIKQNHSKPLVVVDAEYFLELLK